MNFKTDANYSYIEKQISDIEKALQYYIKWSRISLNWM